MTTIRLKFRPSTVEGRPGTIYYQICRHQAVRRINTRIHIHPQQWDPDAGRVLTGHGGDAALRNLEHIMEQDMRRLRETVERMDASGKDYTIDEVPWNTWKGRPTGYSRKAGWAPPATAAGP